MDVFNCHQQHQISLFECKPIQKLFACKEYGKVHLFESSYKNKLVSKFFKFCCLFLFFICRVVHGHNKQLLTTIRLHKCSSC